MLQWDKVLKSESFNSDKWYNLILYLIHFWHNLVYDILLHFKPFNQMDFVSEISYEFKKKSFHFRTKSVMMNPSYSISFRTENHQLIKDTDYLDEQPSMSTFNFLPSDTAVNVSQSQSMRTRNDHESHAFTITFLGSILGQNFNINCHDLQTRYSIASCPVY